MRLSNKSSAVRLVDPTAATSATAHSSPHRGSVHSRLAARQLHRTASAVRPASSVRTPAPSVVGETRPRTRRVAEPAVVATAAAAAAGRRRGAGSGGCGCCVVDGHGSAVGAADAMIAAAAVAATVGSCGGLNSSDGGCRAKSSSPGEPGDNGIGACLCATGTSRSASVLSKIARPALCRPPPVRE